MATYIKTLKEDNGDITYPQTKAGAVLLNNGSDLETELSQYVTAEEIGSTAAVDYSEILSRIYPVGSIYMSATLSTAAQVNATLGGTWVAWGAGRVPVGVDSSQTEFDTVEETGGSKYIQNHTHDIRWNGQSGRRVLMSYTSGSVASFDLSGWQAVNAVSSDTSPVNLMAGKVHEPSDNFGLLDTGDAGNLQPYITCYMYKRIS